MVNNIQFFYVKHKIICYWGGFKFNYPKLYIAKYEKSIIIQITGVFMAAGF